MDEQGLAAQGQQGQAPSAEEMVMKVAELLAQGVTPEELLAKGVPKEIIDMAIQMLQQQAQTSAQPMEQPRQVMPPDQGLAGQGMV